MENARKAMETVAQAIRAASCRLDGRIERAVELILAHSGKVILTGAGKSGHVARMLAATFQSTGTPAVFLNALEAAHGDLGVCQTGDPVILISKSGTTSELVNMLPRLKELGSPRIGILGNVASPLARAMDVVLDASVQRESDPEGFTPTASVAVALAVGQALAVALIEARGFTAGEFAHLHAGGQLGRNLRVRVADVMHPLGEVACVAPGDSLKQVVIAMSARPLGAACVMAEDQRLAGLITDGDVRRALRAHDDIRELSASDVMTRTPVHVSPEALAHEALSLMEDRPSQVSVLPVVEESSQRCVGLVRVHDIYQSGASID